MSFVSELFQVKQANPAATAVNNAGNGHGSMPGTDPFLSLSPKHGAMEADHKMVVEAAGFKYLGTEEGMVWFNEPGGSTLVYKLSGGEPTVQSITDEVERWKKSWKKAAAGEGDRVVEFMRQLGWKRPGRSGASVTDFQSPNGQDEIWVDWDQWRHMSRVSGQWQELSKGTTLKELKAELKRKMGRSIMHDDSGATTGLRSRPDYGESDSYTTQMNEANSKGAAVGYIVAVDSTTTTKEAATKIPMFVASVGYDTKDSMKLTKFTFSPDRIAALVLPMLVAEDLSRQISGPRFAVRSQVITAAPDYPKMFGSVVGLVPKEGGNELLTLTGVKVGQSTVQKLVNQEIEWAKRVLKKQDRVIWYLRLYRLALANGLWASAINKDVENERLHAELKPAPGKPQQPVQAAAPAQPGGWGDIDPNYEPFSEKPVQKMPTRSDKFKELVAKLEKELAAKGGNVDGESTLDDFPRIKQNLEHFMGMPVPEIQNFVFQAQSYEEIKRLFGGFEESWQERAVRLIRPEGGDKIWMQFPDGWAWWILDRSSCPLEAKAMGHCGNSPRSGRTDQRILSLRQPKQAGKEVLWEPHLTFILHGGGEDGTLGEMKGRSNQKPAQQYHPYIVAMLKDPRIHGFVGATWMTANNFRMTDLTEAQRAEIYAANSHLQSGGIKGYYEKHGMDERLIKQITSVLELGEEAKYDPEQRGFIIKHWENEKAFIEDCGTRDAQNLYAFVNNDKKNPVGEPDDDDLRTLIFDYSSEGVLRNIGQSLQNEFPKETREWFSLNDPYDPADKIKIRELLEQLQEPYFTSDKAEWPDEPRVHGEKDKSDTSKYKYRKIKTLDAVREAYHWGTPDADSVGQYLDDEVSDVLNRTNDNGTRIVEIDNGYAMILGEEDAVETAESVSTEKVSAPTYRDPSISVPDSWDNWNDEQASEGLAEKFSNPLTFSTPADKRQKRLFKEPKTDEEAKQKGIAISRAKSPLWWA